jgi:hypothetical protein
MQGSAQSQATEHSPISKLHALSKTRQSTLKCTGSGPQLAGSHILFLPFSRLKRSIDKINNVQQPVSFLRFSCQQCNGFISNIILFLRRRNSQKPDTEFISRFQQAFSDIVPRRDSQSPRNVRAGEPVMASRYISSCVLRVRLELTQFLLIVWPRTAM